MEKNSIQIENIMT